MSQKTPKPTNERTESVSSLDACEVCLGTRGGVPGNENNVDGTIMCDYCHSTYLWWEEQEKNCKLEKTD